MKRKIAITVLVVVLLLILFPIIRLSTFTLVEFSMDGIEVPEKVTPAEVEQNKELAQTFYQQLYSAESGTAQDSYLSDDYVEHQMQADFSKEGLATYVSQRLNDYPNLEMIIHRAIGQGDIVFLHVEEKLSADQSVARGEMFRIAEGQITEHWAAEQEVPDEANNDNGMFAGPEINSNSTVGDDNLELVLSSYFDAFVNIDSDMVKRTTTERYIQHSPRGTDGVDSFLDTISSIKFMKAVGFDTQIDVRMAIAEGDYVIMLTHFHLPLGQPHSNVFDVYRLTDDGLKDEHWDVVEAIENEADIGKVFGRAE